jgi:N-acetylglucosaminyl-diphospho-decaprenol L-rhamnosyltransferase
MDVSVIIVSYRTPSLLRRCLSGVLASGGCTLEVVVIDNASGDESADMVAREFPEVRLIRNDENVGFARAVNRAAREASGRYFLLLNPDTVVGAGVIAALVRWFDGDSSIGAGAPITNDENGRRVSNHQVPYSPLEYSLDALTSFFPAAFTGWFEDRVKRRRVELVGDAPLDVDAVYGSALVTPAETFRALGGLDERFFMYLEDIDYCRRVRVRGMRVVLNPAIAVVHLRGQSSVASHEPLAEGMVARHLLQSRVRYVRKVHGVIWSSVLRGCIRVALIGWSLSLPFSKSAAARAHRENMRRAWSSALDA